MSMEIKKFQEYLNDLIIADEDNSIYDATQNVSEADLYNDVLEYGKSNISMLNSMLKDVDRYLFEGFCHSLSAPPFHWPIDKDGNELELKDFELSSDLTFDECLEFVENHPHFQTLDIRLQQEKIAYVTSCHEEDTIDKLSVFCGYNIKHRDVIRIRDLIFYEIQRLNPDNTTSIPPAAPAEKSNNTDNTNNEKLYEINRKKVIDVYEFCIEGRIIDKSITEKFFLNAVDNADFKDIFANAEKHKAKSACMSTIAMLSNYIDSPEWYLKTARSINSEPSRCSGKNLSYERKDIAKAKGLKYKKKYKT